MEIYRNEFNLSNEKLLIIVPKKRNLFLEKTDTLPRPDSLRIDKSPIAERASINFNFRDSTTSYQGEYPYEMTLSKKGSFLTFNILGNKSKVNNFDFVILTNINRDSQVEDEVNIECFDPIFPEKKN